MNEVEERTLDNRNFVREINEYKRNLQKDPDSITTLKKIATIYEEQQQLEDAIAYYQRIVKIASDRADVYLKIASLQVRLQEFSQSLNNYHTALKIQPNQPAWVFIGLGDALSQTNQMDEAILAFRKAVELRPNHGLSYAKLANALSNKNDDRTTIDTYQKAFDLQNQLPYWVYVNFAGILNKNNLFGRSFHICRKAEERYPDKIEAKILLAEALQKQGQIAEAINTYQTIITLDPQQPAWLYQSLANLLVKNKQYELALDYYFTSIKINKDRFYSYSPLDRALAEVIKSNYNHQGLVKLFEGKKNLNQPELSFFKKYSDLGFFGKHGNTIDPLSYYFVNHNIKILYCSIPKNACTLFKNIIVEYSKHKQEYEQSDQNIHQFLVSNRGTVNNFLSCVESQDYFKIVVLRNPFARLASGYLDKFAKHTQPESFAVDVIRDVQQSLGIEIDVEKSITFEQFIQYLSRKKDYELNDHWKPQDNFVGTIKFDLVGQFENLNHTIDILQNNYNIRIKKKGSEHATKYQQFSEDLPFHTLYPQELRSLEGMPKAKQLYSPELETIVRQRYAKDIGLYEQMFCVDLTNLAEYL